jgi:hypothetical protein
MAAAPHIVPVCLEHVKSGNFSLEQMPSGGRVF